MENGGTEPLVHLVSPWGHAVVLPGRGGRLMSFTAGGREWLWRNPELLDDSFTPTATARRLPDATGFAGWANWGGDKTWPAPQGWSSEREWAGPPDPVLDGGAYTVLEQGALRVRMRSGDDPRTGLAVTRTITMSAGEAMLVVDSELQNVADRPIRWAAWSVTQFETQSFQGHGDGRSGLWVGLTDRHRAPVTLFAPDGAPTLERVSEGLGLVPIRDVVGKIGIGGTAGWLAVVAPGGATLTQRFEVTRGAPYPDSGSEVAVWMQYPKEQDLEGLEGLRPTARLVEAETMSPLTRLVPGEVLRHRVTWSLTDAPPFGPDAG
ncbi:DUF4380 domain-containing protein [Actinomadura alba]|uniref:DUF4380 domain-containing protein n=1 Tax=Actinomadura alba TaxID=406431 RepID=A0ABR7LPE2_9ACTN|nr:DUF4380 domain-containing protein [Actinomadura alba]MBC6466718.1 DUF4380 domain-containing protein [Actinomadura alba]